MLARRSERGDAGTAIELSAVGRAGSIWASATDVPTGRHRNMRAYLGNVVTVPQDLVAMALLAAHDALLLVLVLPAVFGF
jgi:hypothetical protein